MTKNLLILAIATILFLGIVNAQGSQKKEKIVVDDTDIIFEGFKVKFGKTYENE